MMRTVLAALLVSVGPARAADVLVYGGTPAGVAAATAAAAAGRSVLLVEPYRWVGGMTANGLSHPDMRTFEGLTGFYLMFTRRVLAHYETEYGPDSPRVRDSLHGTHAEPKVNRRVFEAMLAEHPSITVKTRHRLVQVETAKAGDSFRVTAGLFAGPDGAELRAEAKVWIDASYEGDLAAAAGCRFRVGREGRAEFGESLAPDAADAQVQGYNFRLCLTDDPANMAAWPAPPGYDRAAFAGLLPLFAAGKLKTVFGERDAVYKLQVPPLPNRKRDINDVSRSAVRLSLPELSPKWPAGNEADRDAVLAEQMRHHLGLLHFLRTDPEVPAARKAEAHQWGPCRDEFPETNHWPDQLYVREARRVVGRAVFTQSSTDHAPGDARGRLYTDAITMGDYGPNCHGTAHAGPRVGGTHTGEFYHPCPPYQVPFGVIVPERCDNLLVPVAGSSSHVGFCALRLEPIWAGLGQAAGAAAGLSVAEGKPVPDVSVPAVQRALHAAGAATVYVSDVLPGHPDFAAVQWWGTAGGLHGLAPTPATPGERGKHRLGQYYEAFPGHAAELDKELDADTRARWLKLAVALGLPADRLTPQPTRGRFIRVAFGLAGK